MELYVKSESTGAIERSPGFFFHSCDLRGRKNVTLYPEEDFEAINLLQREGVKFKLIDLSRCSLKMKLRAKIVGINKTPTLILDDGRKLKGLERIKDYFTSLKP